MAELREQIVLTTKDAVGKLAECTERLAGQGINVVAACAWVEGGTGNMLLITDDNAKACAALRETVDSCQTKEVVTAIVPDRPGAMQKGARALADAGINIDRLYATTTGCGEVMIVMDTADNARAAEVLNA
jgi:hypothetical protein